MKIITWNINRFDGVWDWYEKKKDKDIKYREKMAKAIIGYLVKLISNEDDVAVLQEFPYYEYNGSIQWGCDEYSNWTSLFEKNNLTVIEPYKKGLNVTVAVVPKQKSVWKKTDGDDCKTSFKDGYLNKYIELLKEFRILGIHLPSSSVLLPLLHGMGEADRPDLILGDFNSGDYVIKNRWDEERECERQQYRKLINVYGYTDISGGGVTNHITGSSIDHFLIKNTVLFRLDIKNVFIDDNKTLSTLSDHYPIIVELEKKF